MKRFLLFAGDNEEKCRGWKQYWVDFDDRAEVLDYAEHLTSMHPNEPEAKSDWSQVVDTETEEIIGEFQRK